jgi:hypothetical protein
MEKLWRGERNDQWTKEIDGLKYKGSEAQFVWDVTSWAL